MRKYLLVVVCACFWIGCNEEPTAVESTAPKVAHDIEDRADASCLSCHETGEDNAPVTSHPTKQDCLSCHE